MKRDKCKSSQYENLSKLWAYWENKTQPSPSNCCHQFLQQLRWRLQVLKLAVGYLEINEWICEKYSKSSVAGETAILEQFAVSFVHLTAEQLRSTCFSTGIFRIRIMGILCCYWIKMPILQIADWFWCWKLRIHTGYVSEWVSVNTTKKENITMWN